MLVRYFMTEDPITIAPTDSLGNAHAVMKEKEIRRLPVVAEGVLVGIISSSDVDGILACGDESRPAGVRFDESWSERAVREEMTPKPHICEIDTPLEEAAALMRREKIGSLPVVKDREVIGIVTESDIFDAFTQLTYRGAAGKRICFRMPHSEKKAMFGKLFEACQRLDLELLTILTHPLQDTEHDLVTVRAAGERIEELVDEVWDLKYPVMRVD
ncbi:MAG: CBS domain-containing protein [Planctomycetota bacterium]